MSLTQDDLQEIEIISKRSNEAVENDVKEIFHMLADLKHSMITDKNFSKQTVQKKLLTINGELILVAKEVGVTLPR